MSAIKQYTRVPYEVFTIDDLFTNEEIDGLAAFVVDAFDKPVRNFTNNDFDNGKLVQPETSGFIYDRLKPFLPDKYDGAEGAWTFEGVINTIMFAKVQKGKQFGIHTDTGYEYNVATNRFSKYTLLLYLNEDFEGGSTTFFSDRFEELFSVIPKKGRVLCFDIDMFHKGDVVSNGEKLWIGTELVCGKLFVQT